MDWVDSWRSANVQPLPQADPVSLLSFSLFSLPIPLISLDPIQLLMTASRLPRLPDELLHQIFSDKSLFISDLASLALTSRRFLDTVRSKLYSGVTIILLEKADLADPLGLPVYGVESWQLLRTLQDHPNLAALVKKITFINLPRRHFSTDAPSLPTTRQLAVVTFLRLVRNRTKIVVHNSPDNDGLIECLAVVDNRSSITALELTTSSAVDFEELSRLLPDLTELSFGRLDDPVPNSTLLQRLTLLDVFSPTAVLDQLPSLSTTRSTLRELRVPLYVLFDLAATTDLSQFPHLRTLHVYGLGTAQRQGGHSIQVDIANFWKCLGQSPSLQVLSFYGLPFGIYEGPMFSHLGKHPTITIPTLKTIRFDQDVPFDRIATMLDWPLLSTVRQLVLPCWSPTEEGVVARQRKLDAVSTICRGTGIEVMLADEY